uniref:Uncharacterized protein n=1 Tax=Tanacetum cinerariifolium TaxID=118510 RepID=A0A6L2P5C7_TANCI|nr:hypothetical protein [Tanacetum cinerariifolium]
MEFTMGLKRNFKILWIDNLVYLFIKLELTLPVVTATIERGYWRMEFVEKELNNNKADQLLIDGLVTYIERDVFFKYHFGFWLALDVSPVA